MRNILTSIGLAIGMALVITTPASASTGDMSYYWNFDEGTGRSVNDSVGGQNGVMTGSSTGFGWASGKVGVALGMDGASGEGVALPNAFLSGSQGSVSVWLDMMELSDRNIIFSGRSVSDPYTYAAFSIDRDGRPLFQFRDGSAGVDRRAQGTRLIAKNEWVNVVLTANAQSYHMYVNGEEVTVAGENIGRWFPDITNHTLMYRIGTLDAISMNGSFNGYLDDLRIYSRALSSSEITTLYEEGNAARPSLPALVAPKVTLTVSSGSIPFGGSVSLSWKTEKVDTCVASGNWDGTVATSGNKVFVKLANDVSYRLTCSNTYGSVSEAVYVKIEDGSSATTAKGTLTVSEVPLVPPASTVSATAGDDRRAAIDRLIAQILVLIGELQKQLALLQSASR